MVKFFRVLRPLRFGMEYEPLAYHCRVPFSRLAKNGHWQKEETALSSAESAGDVSPQVVPAQRSPLIKFVVALSSCVLLQPKPRCMSVPQIRVKLVIPGHD